MGEYLRLTKYVKDKDNAELKDSVRIQIAINRLAYLEDLIEKGEIKHYATNLNI